MKGGLHSYPSIYNLGHTAIKDLFSGPVLVEEKIDGSQFSFGCTEEGEILCRSKGQAIIPDAPEKMFSLAVATVWKLFEEGKLVPGWTYRGEYLQKPRHNHLVYGRIPINHIILFDINPGEEEYLDYAAKKDHTERLGLEIVPVIYEGEVHTVEMFKEILNRESILGGVKIEGVVIKPLFPLFGTDKKRLMGKYVSEEYRETQKISWKKDNPTQGDILANLGDALRQEARWRKAIQHLQDAGKLEGSVRDIGPLMKEIPADIEKECAEWIKEQLYKWAWPHLKRMSVKGLPEWYKEELLKKQFADESRD